ncbi:MAG TPA: hypothetical protein VEG39_13600 [Clostridia bacterium]|nr:hypothetical protein [Clostridia bacterium]
MKASGLHSLSLPHQDKDLMFPAVVNQVYNVSGAFPLTTDTPYPVTPIC